jgi:hypothetical protein
LTPGSSSVETASAVVGLDWASAPPDRKTTGRILAASPDSTCTPSRISGASGTPASAAVTIVATHSSRTVRVVTPLLISRIRPPIWRESTTQYSMIVSSPSKGAKLTSA